MSNELVSIIAPCYNVSKTLERYLNSILNQSYKNIEVIAVDDGSTDSTSDILHVYIEKFIDEGMNLKYIYQENAGLGSAINTGLKHVQGEYLCWSDPDDYYYPESIGKRVEIFQKNPEYGIVSSDANVFLSSDLKNPIKREAERFVHRYDEWQFEYLLFGDSHFCAGCHMIKMEAFLSVNPHRDIYPARRGQNWQLLLPVYYKYKRYYIDEPLYAYIIYNDSMSSGDDTEEKELLRWDEHETIIMETLKSINMSTNEKNKYVNDIVNNYILKRFYTAIDYKDKNLLSNQYQLMKQNKIVTKKLKNSYYRNKFFICKLYFKVTDMLWSK